jgi:glucosylglycerate synthase
LARGPSLISDDLLRQLMAAGQTDVLVGIPTLNNAATIEPVLAAIHQAIAGGPPQRRVLILNSDGGSDDATPRLVALSSQSRAATLLASHSLRTMHRIAAPFHGLPGKRAAIRTLLAAADLLQVRAVTVVDPASPSPSADLLEAHVREILDGAADFVADAPVRDPREGPLVTQVVRPLLAGVLGASFEDPLGEQFTASARFAAAALRQPAWDDEPLRPGIDMWLRVNALAEGFTAVELPAPPRPRGSAPAAQPLRTIVQQVLLALWACLDRYAARWTHGDPVKPPARPAGDGRAAPCPRWDVTEMEASFRAAARDLQPLWRTALSTPVFTRVLAIAAAAPLAFPDEVWADVLADFTVAWKTSRARGEELATSFAPLYLGRTASFLVETMNVDAEAVRSRHAGLEQSVRERRARLADAWSASGQKGSP